MRYDEHPPPPAVAPYVACLWTLTGRVAKPAFDLILPDGRAELVVHRGDRFRQKLPAGATRVQPRRLIVGQMTGAVAIAPGAHVETIGVRFTPAGLAPLCPFPLSQLADRIERVEAVPAPALRAVANAASSARTLADALTALPVALVNAYAGAAPVDARVLEAVRRITASGGALPIEALTRGSDVSPRWLERRFQATVGLGPKRLARLVRFRRALAALESEAHGDGAAVAAEHGYYDQAHFIAEFRAFAGDAPRRFVEHRLAELTRFFVDRRPAPSCRESPIAPGNGRGDWTRRAR